MNAGMKPKSPDDEVARRITEALAKARLLPAESLTKLQALLLSNRSWSVAETDLRSVVRVFLLLLS